MDGLTLALLKLDYVHPYLVSFGLLLLFTAISIVAIKPRFRLGRAGYFLALGLFLFLVGVRSIIDRLALEALETDSFLIWGLGSYACLMTMGLLLGLASAARSVDAYGHRNSWYMGFIPVIGLILLFKGPKERKRLSFSRLAGNSLLVICGFLLLGMGRVLAEFATGGLGGGSGFGQNGNHSQSGVAQDNNYDGYLNAYLKNRVGKTHLTWFIDNSEALVGTDILGSTVRFTFERVGGLTYKDSTLWRSQQSFGVCTNLELSVYMEMGATIEKRYLTQQGKLLDDVRVEMSTCETLPAQISQYMQDWVDDARSGIRIDDETISTSAESKDKYFKIYFKYSGEKEKLSEEYVKNILCDRPIFKNIMLFDKRVWGVYRSNKDVDLADASVDDETCQSLRKETDLTIHEAQSLAHGGQNAGSSSGYVMQEDNGQRAIGVLLKDKLGEIPPPRAFGESEVLTATEIVGDTIRFTFERAYDETYASLPTWQMMESFEICRDPKLVSYMELGASVERRYLTHQGKLLDDMKVDASVCPTLPTEISRVMQGFAALAARGIRIDDETVSATGEYKDHLFTTEFKYTGDGGKLSESYIQEKMCGHPIFTSITAFDIGVRGVYKSDKGESLGEATVDYGTCQSFEKK